MGKDVGPTVMCPSDFNLEPRGPRLFDVWTHVRGADTPLGHFEFECIVDMGERPDEQMVAGVDAVFQFVQAHPSLLMEALHEHYLRFSRDKEWMDHCGVPLGLPQGDLLIYVRSRSVCASRHRLGTTTEREHYIHISPVWDSEHDIFWRVDGDVLVPLDT